MPDDVLRLRATVVSEEALANIRAIGREIGMVPQRAGRGVQQVNTQFQTLGQTIKNVSRELSQAVPALGGFGLGAAGVGLAAGAMIRSLTDAAKRVNELKYASLELRMSTTELRGWGLAAQQVGISSETMIEGMKNFSQVADGLKYNIGGVRSRLYELGAGPVVRSIMAATTQGEKLREVFKFKDTLLIEPNGIFKAQEWMKLWGLGADSIRLTAEQAEAAMARIKPRTKEAEEAAKKYQEQIAALGEAWDNVVVKFGVQSFPALTRLVGLLEGALNALEKWEALNKRMTIPGGGSVFGTPSTSESGKPLPFDPKNPATWQQAPPSSPGEQYGPPKPPESWRDLILRWRGKTPEGATPPTGFDPKNPTTWKSGETTTGPMKPVQAGFSLPEGAISAIWDIIKKPLGGTRGLAPISMRGLEGTPAQSALDALTQAVKRGTFEGLQEFDSLEGGFGGGFGGGGDGGGAAPGYGIGHGRIGRPGLGGGPGAGPGGAGAGPGGVGQGARPGGPGGAPGHPGGPGGVPSGHPGSPGGPGGPPGGPSPNLTPTPGPGGEVGPAAALAFARQHLGEDEIRDQSKLQDFFRSQGMSVNPRTTAWCADFVNANLKQAGIKGTGSQAAGSFTGYGTGITPEQVQAGDIGVVRGRSPRTGMEGTHVGFLTGETRMGPRGLEVKMLGGNQGGTSSGKGGVSEQWRLATSLHLRRPPGPTSGPTTTPSAQGPGAGQPSYQGGTKATWFDTGGKIPGWSDPSGQREGAQASGLPSTTPGIATPGRTGLGEWFQVTLPDGRTVVTQKTDVGPGKGPQAKGIGLDINAALATQLYPGGPGTFPSGKGGFQVKPLGKNLPQGVMPGLQPVRPSTATAPAGAQVPLAPEAGRETPGVGGGDYIHHGPPGQRMDGTSSSGGDYIYHGPLGATMGGNSPSDVQVRSFPGPQYSEGEMIPPADPDAPGSPADQRDVQREWWKQTDADKERYRERGGGKFRIFSTDRDRTQVPTGRWYGPPSNDPFAPKLGLPPGSGETPNRFDPDTGRPLGEPVSYDRGAVLADRLEQERRIDNAISPTRVNGSVNVTVNSNGTKASTHVKSKGGLFQKSTVRLHRQMRRTEDADSGASGAEAE